MIADKNILKSPEKTFLLDVEDLKNELVETLEFLKRKYGIKLKKTEIVEFLYKGKKDKL